MYERCQFHRILQQANENSEDLLQKLQTQVKRRSYGASADEFVMAQIVVGVYSNNTRQKLWTEDDLTLDKTKKLCRTAERASKQMNELQERSRMSTRWKLRRLLIANAVVRQPTYGSKQCPVFRKECKNSKHVGHFSKMCKSKKKSTKGTKSWQKKVKWNKIKVSKIEERWHEGACG